MSDPLRSVAALVHRHTGIASREHGLSALAAALQRAAPEMGAERFLAAVEGREVASPLLARLVEEVTVKETYFFRAPRELQAVDWNGLWAAALARGASAVHVWVAACATGEEPYTLAILAREAFGAMEPPVRILATDISPLAMARAQEGRYSDRAVRSLPAGLVERYFIQDDGRHHVLDDRVKAMVAFRQHNLISDPPPTAGVDRFAVVSCRNVLIYFDAPTVQRVIGSLEAALAPGGQLILGAADRLSGTAGTLGRVAAASGSVATPAPSPRARRVPQPRVLRSAPAPAPPVPPAPGDRIARALAAADAGDLETAIALTAELTLNADAQFVRGLAELGAGDTAAAAGSFRRAVYLDSSFGLAAFQLARSYDTLGDSKAAQRTYAQALAALDPGDDRHRAILGQVDLADVADACRARLLSGARMSAASPAGADS